MTDRDGGRRGRLVIVGTPIGNLSDLSPRAVRSLSEADVIACEDTRVTRKLLSAASVRAPRLMSVRRENEASLVGAIVRLVEGGATVALVSDAGMPAISDPGQRVIAAAADLPVEVVPGPSAVTAALVVSGLDSSRFCFEGFLPRRGAERLARLREVAGSRVTAVVFEAPKRVGATLADLAVHCGPERRCAVVCELTKLHESVWRGPLGQAGERFAAAELRGEYVIVLEGAPEPPPVDEATIAASLAASLEAGLRGRSAVDQVAAGLGVSRRRVYDVLNSRTSA
ncbi:MAG TPA: 16S rRNA (cytidine(1402)-2'-O)-methyltransferase [Candidatus Dormibacteraeota bacterium]